MDSAEPRPVRAVLDTNVVVYHLLGTNPFAEEVDALWPELDDPIAPASWEAELINVLWLAVRARQLTQQSAHVRLELALQLGIRSVPSRPLLQSALAIGVQEHVSGYDALFVAVAARERRPLVTFDKRLLETFPDIAARPAALARRR